ncbi:MAG: imidazole glycerol phosphate synthase subunit HisH 2 [Chitinophagales bacterium]|nr:MAG: imidazole glycerol phosphate synthase subunit HisH 2 [Chitinophagales bacterium]
MVRKTGKLTGEADKWKYPYIISNHLRYCMIVVVDYHMGNLSSIVKAFNRLKVPIHVTNNSSEIGRSKKIILPGVGHFGKAMETLQQEGLVTTLNELVIYKKVPIMGICLGMQLMARYSEEGNARGFGWLNASVVRFKTNQVKVPHMGWNTVEIKNNLLNLPAELNNQEFYFSHSYHWQSHDGTEAIGMTKYEYPFASIVAKDNIIGLQFHPEKSHQQGLRLLKFFIEL